MSTSTSKSKHKILYGNKGYALSKSVLSEKEVETIKQELTATPKLSSDYGGEAESFPVYFEDKQYLYVPRYWGVERFGPPIKSIFNHSAINIQFTGQLRDTQLPIIDQCLKGINRDGGGIISVHCGGGKTTMSLYLIAKLKLKALVIVHKTFLQDQWYDRIKQFTDAKIGVIRQNKVDIKDKDIVIGMIQSISCRDYDPEIFKQFGIIIVDEAHHAGSKVYSRTLQKIQPRYTVGLSATPDRYDGMTKVIKWYLGDIMYKSKRKKDKNVITKRFLYESSDKLFTEKKMWTAGKTVPAIQRMVTNMYKMQDRNKFLVSIINCLRKQYERKILVLSGRRNHLEGLKQEIDRIINLEVETGVLEKDEVKTAYYVGQMKGYQLVESAEADIIFATYSMAKEGLDIDRLNTLVLATPEKSVVQSIGRIMRKPIQEGDIIPLIVDVVDRLSLFTRWGEIREALYKKNGYRCNDYIGYDSGCVSVKQYLIKKGVLKDDRVITTDEIRRKYLTYRFGPEYLEFEDELASDGEEDNRLNPIHEELFNYNPSLDKVLSIPIGYIPEDG